MKRDDAKVNVHVVRSRIESQDISRMRLLCLLVTGDGRRLSSWLAANQSGLKDFATPEISDVAVIGKMLLSKSG